MEKVNFKVVLDVGVDESLMEAYNKLLHDPDIELGDPRVMNLHYKIADQIREKILAGEFDVDIAVKTDSAEVDPCFESEVGERLFHHDFFGRR